MKSCPKCAFQNEECFPTCVWCNTSLAGVRSTAPQDPSHPEHERFEQQKARSRLLEGKERFAAVFYAFIIAFTAAIPGMVFSLGILGLYWVSGLVVGLAARAGILGQFTCILAQGALSGTLLIYFGPLQPFIFFMLAGHLILAGFMWHWMSMIFETHC
jgi:hypothetical protein